MPRHLNEVHSTLNEPPSDPHDVPSAWIEVGRRRDVLKRWLFAGQRRLITMALPLEDGGFHLNQRAWRLFRAQWRHGA